MGSATNIFFTDEERARKERLPRHYTWAKIIKLGIEAAERDFVRTCEKDEPLKHLSKCGRG